MVFVEQLKISCIRIDRVFLYCFGKQILSDKKTYRQQSKWNSGLLNGSFENSIHLRQTLGKEKVTGTNMCFVKSFAK